MIENEMAAGVLNMTPIAQNLSKLKQEEYWIY